MPVTCQACGFTDKIDFHVPDEVWNAAVPEARRRDTLCLPCFDRHARAAGVRYSQAIEVSFLSDNPRVGRYEIDPL